MYPRLYLAKNLLRDDGVIFISIDEGEISNLKALCSMLYCLDKELTQELMDALAELEPARVICLDAGFQGNDQLKSNAVQTFKSRARSKETTIEFRTV